MKVIRGGGGIDKEGNWYELPNEAVEVPDDAFDNALRAIMNAPRPDFIPCSQGTLEIIRKTLAAKGS